LLCGIPLVVQAPTLLCGIPLVVQAPTLLCGIPLYCAGSPRVPEDSWGALVIGVQKLAEHHQEIPLLTCWIDCFAINQHGAQERLKELESTVAVSSNFMIIGDPPAVFTRAWCLYEVVTWLFSGKKKISLCAGTLDEASRTFITAEPAAVAAAVDGINLASAKASVARDSDEIFKLVRERIPGGMETVNETVKGALMTEALSTKEAPLVDEFDAVRPLEPNHRCPHASAGMRPEGPLGLVAASSV
jgi:hypothetical protein